jgi:hypothetical protein
MKEALCSSETSDFTRATRHIIPEGAILHSHRRENLKSCRFNSVSIETKGFRRLCMTLRIAGILDCVHRSEF